MKIFEVILQNYRQYEGEIPVQFSTDLSKNMTVIRGNNGEGKSNLMNAITWCLYGDEMFKSKMNVGREIINENALFNSSDGEAVLSVTVEMGNNNPEYIFQRIHKFQLRNGKPVLAKQEFKCKQKTSIGTETIANPEWIIERKFIPKDLRGFFFFDGEKMDEYFEDTSKIKANVEKIAQIDVLNGVIDTLNSVKNEINGDIKKLAKSSDSEYPDIDDKYAELQSAKEKKERVVQLIQENEEKKNVIDEYLRNHSSAVVKQLTKTRDELKNSRSNTINKRDGASASLKNLIYDSISIVFAYSALERSRKLIEENTEKGVLPPDIKDVFLEDLLKKNKCICGRSLEEGSECRKEIEKLLQSLIPNDIALDSVSGKYRIEALLRKVDFTEEYRKQRLIIKECEDELGRISEELETISNNLSSYDEFDIQEKESQRRELERNIKLLSSEKGSAEYQIRVCNDFLQNCDEQIRKIQINDQKVSNLKALRDYTMTVLGVMTDIKNSIVDDVRQKLESRTRDYFFNMIWKKEAFSDVRIIDEGYRYRISVKSARNQECLGDLSAGERQVLALSFTAALYSVSGYSVPVFIDTPLGRISEKPRENVADYLPNYLSDTQLIMLPTDAEYTKVIRSKLSGCVGNEYKISYDSKTRTSRIDKYE